MASLADESIIAEFVAESREHLATVEPDLLAMEERGKGVSQEVINRVFRAVHSLKGGRVSSPSSPSSTSATPWRAC